MAPPTLDNGVHAASLRALTLLQPEPFLSLSSPCVATPMADDGGSLSPPLVVDMSATGGHVDCRARVNLSAPTLTPIESSVTPSPRSLDIKAVVSSQVRPSTISLLPLAARARKVNPHERRWSLLQVSAASGSATSVTFRGDSGGDAASVAHLHHPSLSQKRGAVASPPHSNPKRPLYADQNEPPNATREPMQLSAHDSAASSACSLDFGGERPSPQPLGAHNASRTNTTPVTLTPEWLRVAPGVVYAHHSREWAEAHPWLLAPSPLSAEQKPSLPPSIPSTTSPLTAAVHVPSITPPTTAAAAARWEATTTVAPKPATPLHSRLTLAAWGLPSCVVDAYARQGVTEMYPWQAAALETAERGENLVRVASSHVESE
jgi:hypothetical protein